MQFDNDNCANQAIQHENGSILNGRKLNVKNAMKNKPTPGDGQPSTGPIVGQDLNRQARPVMTQNWNNRSILQNTRDMGRDRSPLNDKGNFDRQSTVVNSICCLFIYMKYVMKIDGAATTCRTMATTFNNPHRILTIETTAK